MNRRQLYAQVAMFVGATTQAVAGATWYVWDVWYWALEVPGGMVFVAGCYIFGRASRDRT